MFNNNNFFIINDNESFLNKKEEKYLFLKEDLLILTEKSINNIELNIKYYCNSLVEKIFINNNLKNDNIAKINFVNKI